MAKGKRTIFNDYSRSKDALRKRIARIEKNTNMFFPADILEGKTIEEMNALREKELEEIAVKFTTRVINGEITKTEEIRTGKTQGNTKEDVEEILEEIKETILSDSDVELDEDSDYVESDNDADDSDYDESDEDSEDDSDYDDSDYEEPDYGDDYYDYNEDLDDYDPYEEYEDDKSRYTYGDDLEIEYWKSQFFTSPLQDIADKFIRKAIKYYGLDNVRLGIESVISEKPEFTNYSPSDDRFITSAMSYLREVNAIMKDIASNNDFDMEPYYSGGETIINSFISEFEFAIESGESYSEIY